MADNAKENQNQKPSVRMKLFDILGLIAYLLLIPPILSMFDITAPLTFLSEKLGTWGTTPMILVYFYTLHFLRIFFGSDVRLTPVFISYIMSFLLFSMSFTTIGFMQWLYNLTHAVQFFSFDPVNCVAAMLIVLLGNGISAVKSGKLILDVILLIVLPVALIILASIFLMPALGVSPNVIQG
ncbi:MAG TPA: hypothetical protein P5522_00745 [Spirochaetia bacterium]|nr:hypothetical protein [Spirochaetia bacterium]